jgi:HK97 gp10 family phage protein
MVTLTGVKEIDRVLKGMKAEMSHQVLGAANLAAAKPLILEEQRLAPVGKTRTLVNSIGAKKQSLRSANEIGAVLVGPQRSKKGFAAPLVEFGTKRRRTRKGANRGIMPATPFVRPAFENTKEQVEQNIKTEIGKKLVTRMKRELGSAYIR